MNNDDENKLEIPNDLPLFYNKENLFIDDSILNILPDNEKEKYTNIKNDNKIKKPKFDISSNQQLLYNEIINIEKTISSELNYKKEHEIQNENKKYINQLKTELKLYDI